MIQIDPPKSNKRLVNIQKIQHLNHRGNGIKYNLIFQSNHSHNGYMKKTNESKCQLGYEEIKNPCSLFVEVKNSGTIMEISLDVS